jgi:hypothetical protein
MEDNFIDMLEGIEEWTSMSKLFFLTYELGKNLTFIDCSNNCSYLFSDDILTTYVHRVSQFYLVQKLIKILYHKSVQLFMNIMAIS